MSHSPKTAIRRALLAGGLVYVAGLAAGLVWLHLSPLLVLALTLGAVGLAAIVFNPVIAIHVFIMLLFVEKGLTTGGSNVTVMKMVGPFILLAWLISLAARRKAPFESNPLVFVMMLFIIWCGVSVIYAFDATPALVRFGTLAQLSVATLMFASVADSPKRIRDVFASLVLWTTLTTAISIGLYYVGISPMVRGIREDRNSFAIYINVAIVCAYALLRLTPTRGVRLLLTVSLPVLLLGLALTFSRAGFVVLLSILLLIAYRTARERRLGVAMALILIMGLVGVLAPGAVWERMGSILPSVQYREDTFGIRVNLWELGLEMIHDRPMTGVGAGNFQTASLRYARGDVTIAGYAAHNSYISVAAETGILGIGLFLAMHLLAINATRKILSVPSDRNDPLLPVLASATQYAILIVMLSALSISCEGIKHLWILFGLSLSLGRLHARAAAAATVNRAV
ncbi:MAG: O-antigen ligase family protein, partial [Tepidiformaceae bacterium]